MFVLVTGGSGSGKSAYAEQVVLQLDAAGGRYYLATMQVYGEEGQKKVQRHQRLRAGKGFVTIEQPTDIAEAAEKLGRLQKERRAGTVLLECMSNLTANEMFAQKEIPAAAQVAKKVLQETQLLSAEAANLVIVTNNVFEDGNSYDETTVEYMRALGMINEELAERADRVIEVVVGIPVVIKENNPVQ